MPFRFLHLADLHLETSFGGRPETRERLRQATREAFERAVDYAIEERLHAVLAAGDLFDDRLLSRKVERWLCEQVERLAKAGVWFLACCGNHDPGAAHLRTAQLGVAATHEEADAAEAWRKRVHFFRHAAPETVPVLDRDGNIAGLVVGAGHTTATESNNLAAAFPRIDEALPVVGLLHTHVAAATSADAHDRYAPSAAADYEQLEYGYWALGHIHIRQQALPGQPVYYAGNLQGRNPREVGAKGGLVVEVRAKAPAEPAFVRFAPVRWERLLVNSLPDTQSLDLVVENLVQRVDAMERAPDETLALRIELSGTSPLAHKLRHAETCQEIEAELAERTGALEVQLRTRDLSQPIDTEALRASPTVVAEALDLIDTLRTNPARLDEWAPEELATPVAHGEERERYLEELLADLSQELIERSFAGDDA